MPISVAPTWRLGCGEGAYPNLNHAFIDVLKDDFGVKNYIEIHEATQKSREAIYVK